MKSLHSTWLLVPSTHRVLPSCAHSAYPDMWGSETQIDITLHLLSFNFFQKPRKTNNYLINLLNWNQLTWLLKQIEVLIFKAIQVTKKHTPLPTLIVLDILCPFLNSQNLSWTAWKITVCSPRNGNYYIFWISFAFTFVPFNVYHALKMSKSKFLGIVRWWLTSGMCKKTQVVWRMKTLPPEFMFELRLLKTGKMKYYTVSCFNNTTCFNWNV